MSRVVDEHRQYLQDRHRLDAYTRAIASVVGPDDCVLDLGSGTGVLGLLACRAGARIVYAIEATAIAGLAAQVRDANGFHDRLAFVRGHSTTVTLPEPADVIVSDQIGRFGFEAGILQYFSDARRRLLKPGACFVPRTIELVVAPIDSPRLYRRIGFWDSRPAGLEFHPVRGVASNTAYPARFRRRNLLATGVPALRIDLSTAEPERLALDATLRIERRGHLHGIGGWFRAELALGIWMSNSPVDRSRIRRRQVFFPIEQPVAVAPGDVVAVRVQILPEDLMVTWEVGVSTAGESRTFRHSTLRGMLLTREDLERTLPSYRPALTPRGIARRLILELCDGGHTLAAIEDEVYRRHAALFPDRAHAAVFVAEVVTRYTTASLGESGVDGAR